MVGQDLVFRSPRKTNRFYITIIRLLRDAFITAMCYVSSVETKYCTGFSARSVRSIRYALGRVCKRTAVRVRNQRAVNICPRSRRAFDCQQARLNRTTPLMVRACCISISSSSSRQDYSGDAATAEAVNY
jgi:tRNA G26 N,N-dimethylase Trm1